MNTKNLPWPASVGVLLLAVSIGALAQAPGNCTSSLNGTYGWLAEGMLAAGNSKAPKLGNSIPLVQVGYITFDGNGNFSGAHDTSLGGDLIPHVDSGTYSVNSDCTTGTISFATGVGFIVSIVITSGGQEIKFVSATTGGVTPGTLRLAAVAPCSASALSGKSYGYAAHGLAGAGSGNSFPRAGGFVPFANAGQISFGADGTISGVDNANFGGVVMPGQPVAGTYVLNSDCTGTATMTIAGVDASWHFVVLQGAEQIIFIATPSGYVWAGTLAGIS